MTRQTKTPMQRAEEALAVADRRYARAVATQARLGSELAAAQAEVEEGGTLRAYAKQHPALANPATTTQKEGTNA